MYPDYRQNDAAVTPLKEEGAYPAQGVRGRNSDNTRVRQILGWEPRISLEEGLARTYAWIEAEIQHRLTAGAETRMAM